MTELETFIIDNNYNGLIYAAITSHISSTPSAIFNAKKITELLHKYDILSIIDGAHVIGQIELNIDDIDCDFYVSNGHKWLMSPPGSAIMFVKMEFQHLIYPLTISNGAPSFGNQYIDSLDTSLFTQFQKYFIYQGTDDHIAYISMLSALEFRKIISNNNDKLIMEYCHQLAVNGGNLIANIWNTSRLVKNDMNVGNMVNIKLPTQNQTQVKFIQNVLFRQTTKEKYTFLPVFKWNGIFYARVSAQVYNEISDFEWFARIVLEKLKLVQDSQLPDKFVYAT